MEDQLVERLIVRGIHVYRFYKNNRQAVDHYIELVDPDIQAHIDSGQADKPFLYVLDVSQSGMFPVNYVRQRVSSLVKTKSQWPESYIAYVTDNPNDSILVELINALTTRELDHTRKVFKTEEFEQAIDWLLEVRHAHAD